MSLIQRTLIRYHRVSTGCYTPNICQPSNNQKLLQIDSVYLILTSLGQLMSNPNWMTLASPWREIQSVNPTI
jgi:hypothetical protein